MGVSVKYTTKDEIEGRMFHVFKSMNNLTYMPLYKRNNPGVYAIYTPHNMEVWLAVIGHMTHNSDTINLSWLVIMDDGTWRDSQSNIFLSVSLWVWHVHVCVCVCMCVCVYVCVYVYADQSDIHNY